MLSVGGRFTGHCRHIFTSPWLQDLKIKMPSLSPTMSAGTIVKWLRKEGESIAAGDALCEIQTDKAIVTMETDEEGTLAKILVAEGTADVNVGNLIAVIAESGEDWKAVQSSAVGLAVNSAPPTSAKPALPGSPNETQVPAISEHGDGKMGPAVRLLLQLYGLSPSSIPATGRSSTLLKGDVQKYIASHNLKPKEQAARKLDPLSDKAPMAAAQKPAVSLRHVASFSDVPLSNMRKTVAKRLSDSKRNSPHAYSTMELNASEILSARANLKRQGVVVSMNDFIVKGCALALRLVPDVNVNLDQAGNLQQLHDVDVSVAVAMETGLITPIVRAADRKGLAEISANVKELVAKAKSNKLQLNEFQGGTFTVSNLGMFGITEFTAIINPPQAAILAVGGVSEVLDISLKVRSSLRVTLCYDRRAIPEDVAFRFLSSLKGLLESPSALLSGTNEQSALNDEDYLC